MTRPGSRSLEARIRRGKKASIRRCRNKMKYASWPDAERIQRLNMENGETIFTIYPCPICASLHLATRKDIPMPKQFRNMLEKAS